MPLSQAPFFCTVFGMNRFFRFIPAGFLVLLLAACGTSTSLPPAQSGDPQVPPDFSLLADIPIPATATLDNDHSLILGDRDRWTGKVVMRVQKSAPEMAAFYQQQMPGFGWETVMAATSGVTVLTFVRADRAASVQIEPGSMWGATVQVIVGPRGNSGAPPAAPARSSMSPVSGSVRSDALPATRR